MRSSSSRLGAISLAVVAALALGGCTSNPPANTSTGTDAPPSTSAPANPTTEAPPPQTSGAPSDGKDSVTYASLPGTNGPSYLAPFNPGDKMNTANSALKALLWVPLIQTGGAGGTMGWDKAASVASDYACSADGLTVDITLGDYTWSDGRPVTTRDVEFQYNLIVNNIADDPATDRNPLPAYEGWASYSAGKFPDNVSAFTVVDDKHLSITWDKVYNPDWLVYNQLIYLIPLPQHVMGVDSTGAAADDRTPEGAKAIWAMMMDEGKNVATYSTNPLWQVVDGPYKVQEWTQDNSVTLVANAAYAGPDKPSITTVIMKPYTSEDAEMNDLRAGALDYGYITATQMANQSQFLDLGYNVSPWLGWGITYAPYNFAHDTNGPIFSQLYVRQALQQAIDQPTMVESLFYNTANANYGPVPQGIDSGFLSDVQKNNPYPYDMTKAAQLFADNGWTKGADGMLTCTSPGTDAGQCGDGIAAGTPIKLNAVIETAEVTVKEWTYIQSQFKQLGVDLTLTQTTDWATPAQSCNPANNPTSCDSWDFVFFGTAGSWYFPAYPTGERLFYKDVMRWNCGQYNDPQANDLIDATLTGTDTTAMEKYSNYLAENLPVLWLPMPSYQISAVASGLDVGTQDPGGSFTPQRWSWSA